MKWNFIIIFVVIVMGALSAIYFKVDQDFYAEKIQWNTAQSRGQLSAFTHTLEAEFENLSRILDLTYPNLSNRDYEKNQAFSRFEMISTFQIANGDIQLARKFYLEQTPVRDWAESYVYLTLKGAKESDLQENALFTVLDPQRKPWLLLVSKSKTLDFHYAALVSTDLIQSFVDRQKGQMSTISIVNSQGHVLGHSIREYVGSLLKEDPLVAEFIKSGNASGSGLFDGFQGERVHGFYEQVNQSNLYVTITTPVRVLTAERKQIKFRFILMGIGISLVGVALLMYFNQTALSDEEQIASENIRSSEFATQNLNGASALKSEELLVIKNTEVPKSAVPVTITKKTNIPPPPPLKSKISDNEQILSDESKEKIQKRVEDEKKFGELFDDKKIEETMQMIDDLDSKPVVEAPPLTPLLTPQLMLLEKTITSVPAAAPTAEPPPLKLAPSQRAPQITIQRKVSKLDELEVRIRKPGEIS